ncbi:MAG: hypothetical protein ACPGSG_03430 [Prolixibacteraceae bacterium]|jgi:hypothetical protein|nr:hypothetical protein [Prolixibacteraceae bacterium]
MLDYARIILPKVSFSEELFEKELLKCIEWVGPENLKELFQFCQDNFGIEHGNIIQRAFK